ncbi:hypothetical protein [Methylobacterium radiotolerans]|uniref:hypothetical protein n=1 Tax=Methylobacterium radiotolerans TaxID=31998 RepID=UPI001AD8157C|nr:MULTISPECIES: hypothetical protein [Methylobacterium]MDE3744433.1 hypothetical protein [Methylobacterium radiotolerans]
MTKLEVKNSDPFELHDEDQIRELKNPHVHKLRKGFRCITDRADQESPNGFHAEKLVVNAAEDFIPVRYRDVILRWQFAEGTLKPFKNPSAAGSMIETLIDKALLAWGMPHR